jgi:hypothetical protein
MTAIRLYVWEQEAWTLTGFVHSRRSTHSLAVFPSQGGLYLSRSIAYLAGTARFEPPNPLSTAKFMPITFPSRLKSGPPDPPEVVARRRQSCPQARRRYPPAWLWGG